MACRPLCCPHSLWGRSTGLGHPISNCETTGGVRPAEQWKPEVEVKNLTLPCRDQAFAVVAWRQAGPCGVLTD